MKKRGEVNIGMADYLYKNSNDIIKNINSNFNPEDINHIIIGRWYYGLFLITKNYLINNCHYISSCKKKSKCPYSSKGTCNAECLLHKGTKFKKKSKKKNKYIYIKKPSIWEILCNKMSTISQKDKNNLKSRGIELAKLREKYEYSGNNCSVNEIKLAENYLLNIKKVYINEKII